MGGSGGQVLKSASTSRATAGKLERRRGSLCEIQDLAKTKICEEEKTLKGCGFFSNVQLGPCLLLLFLTHTAQIALAMSELKNIHSSNTGLRKSLMESQILFLKEKFNGKPNYLPMGATTLWIYPSCDCESLRRQLHIPWDFTLSYSRPCIWVATCNSLCGRLGYLGRYHEEVTVWNLCLKSLLEQLNLVWTKSP